MVDIKVRKELFMPSIEGSENDLKARKVPLPRFHAIAPSINPIQAGGGAPCGFLPAVQKWFIVD